MKTKIYIVEDETIVTLELKRILLDLGYSVCGTAINYDKGYREIIEFLPDIILMDINLKNSKSGIELSKELQKTHTIPVIYLTAYNDTHTLSSAISTNPVGYINKPFKRSDIYTAIELGLHKATNNSIPISPKNIIELGYGYSFHLKNNVIWFENTIIKLGSKEFHFLRILIEARGNVVPYSQIKYEIWPDGTSSENLLRSLIHRVRIKLHPKIIENIHGVGCKLNRYNSSFS